MKKAALIIMCIAATVFPAIPRAEVMAGAGNVTLLGHIDFVYRYSAEDGDIDKDADYWPGYDTYNVEFAVLGMAGQLGDNVDWVVVEAFTFVPAGSVFSALENGDFAGAANNQPNLINTSLLDARINWHLGDAATLSVGRFIPPTSMTWNPHLMKVLCTINYPLLNGGGLQGLLQTGTGSVFIPPPMYQTGAMLTLKGGPASFMIGTFNGTDLLGPPPTLPGVNNGVDIDRAKGTLAKLAVDTNGFHLGGWYWWEDASVTTAGNTLGVKTTRDAKNVQWGAEASYNSDRILFQAQYLSTSIDFNDSAVKDDLVQSGWYVLAGVIVNQFQIVGRYDYFSYDMDDLMLSDDMDEETATTAGVNYMINESTTLGVNYTWRDVEDWDANLNELAVIIEANLF